MAEGPGNPGVDQTGMRTVSNNNNLLGNPGLQLQDQAASMPFGGSGQVTGAMSVAAPVFEPSAAQQQFFASAIDPKNQAQNQTATTITASKMNANAMIGLIANQKQNNTKATKQVKALNTKQEKMTRAAQLRA